MNFYSKLKYGIIALSIATTTWAVYRTFASAQDVYCTTMRADNKAYLQRTYEAAVAVCHGDVACLDLIDTLTMPQTLTILETEEKEYGCE